MRGNQDTPRPHPHVVLPEPDPAGDEELVGLRQDDLAPEEKRRLLATLSTNRGARDRERAMTLARELGSLPVVKTDLHPGHVLEELARRRRNRRWLRVGVVVGGIAGVAAVAAAVTASLAPTPGRTQHHVTIEADATHGSRSLPVWREAEIPSDASLTLSVTTTGAGTLFVQERFGYGQVRPLAPSSGRWDVEAGEHPVIGPVRPVHVPLDVRYEAWLCPPNTDKPSIQRCRIDKVDVSWR